MNYNVRPGAGWKNLEEYVGDMQKNVIFNGVIDTVEFGEDVDLGEVVYLKLSDGKYYLAKADSANTTPAVAIALEDVDVSEYAYGKVLFQGFFAYTEANHGTNASGTITIDGDVADGDTVTINGVVFEFTDDGTITDDSYYPVDVSEGLTTATSQPALTAAITAAVTANDLNVTLSDWETNVLTVTAGVKGYAGNDVTLAKDGMNIAVSGAKFTNGEEGGVLYTSDETAGAMLRSAPDTAGDQVQTLGFAVNAEEIIFRPSFDISEIAGG